MMQTVTVGNVQFGPKQPMAIIAGPCVAESLDICLKIAERVREKCDKLGFGYIFKASFDKANRSSHSSFRGMGIDETLEIFRKVKAKLGVPVTTDIHESHHAALVAGEVDLLQIPAFLCRQTDLLLAAAATGRAVNVKKGQFLSPAEMSNAIKKLSEGFKAASKPARIILTERGTFFGYNRLVNDFVGLGDMMEMGWPVCFDVTHSTQQPGGQGNSSGGRPERAPLLARCATVAGVQSLFIETHPEPSKALSDAATMLNIEQTLAVLDDVAKLRTAMA